MSLSLCMWYATAPWYGHRLCSQVLAVAVYNHYKRIIHDRTRQRAQEAATERACSAGTPVVHAGLHPSTVEGSTVPAAKGTTAKAGARGRATREPPTKAKGQLKGAEEEELVLDKSNILLLVRGTWCCCVPFTHGQNRIDFGWIVCAKDDGFLGHHRVFTVAVHCGCMFAHCQTFIVDHYRVQLDAARPCLPAHWLAWSMSPLPWQMRPH